MNYIKKWFENFFELYFPSMSAYKMYDKELLRYIEENVLVEVNCKRILTLSWLFVILPFLGVFKLFSIHKGWFCFTFVIAILLCINTIYVGKKMHTAFYGDNKAVQRSARYYYILYNRYWYVFFVGMSIIGFVRVGLLQNAAFLLSTQLCLAFLPLFTKKTFKNSFCFLILTAFEFIILVIYKNGLSNESMFLIFFVVQLTVTIFIISFIIQSVNTSICVMSQYVKNVSFLDPLTGAFNRRGVMHQLSELNFFDSYAGVIMLDIDYFKQYNDTYGHVTGDEILVTMVKAIKSVLQQDNQFVVRYGGEEFAILCINNSLQETVELSEKIMQAINRLNFPCNNPSGKGCLTVSIGVDYRMICKSEDLEDYIAEADKALYYAKEHGRNCVVIYSDIKGQIN